jgi:membrane associated rhomboid family serine protease
MSFPIATPSIIVVNFVVFALELINGDAFVAKWSLVPADISAGHNQITILTAMFMHASWAHRTMECRHGRAARINRRRLFGS